MSRLSAAGAAGIETTMNGAVVFAVALAALGCDMRPLTSAELYGGAGSGGHAGSSGHGGANGGSAGGARGGSAGGTDGWDAARDAVADAGPTDAADAGCAQACATDQFCNELTGQCSPRTGTGMLSGVVTDACSGLGVSALVGIAGGHTCSYEMKGSYFFGNLPLGMLKLAATKDGYDLYGATVEIVPGGVVRDIALARVGGCAAPAPADTACTCTTPSCTPP